MTEHRDISVTGRVQGVSFRYYAKQAADKLNITGYVKNIRDGSVFIEAEGTSEALDTFAEWCHSGPDRAEVKNVYVQNGKVKGYPDFSTF